MDDTMCHFSAPFLLSIDDVIDDVMFVLTIKKQHRHNRLV